MRLYYTVASAPEDIQTKTNLSLGGYKSVNPVQNAAIGNMFGDISMYTVKNSNGNRYIGLILKNEGLYDATDILVWFVYPTGCSSKLSIAAVDLIADAESNKFMEHIPTTESKPLYATFSEADGESDQVNIGDLDKLALLGIWIERELLLDDIKAEQNAIYTVNPNDPYRYNEVVLGKEDLIEIHISWTDVTP